MTSPSKPFLLYTATTPNGFQTSIFFEELKAVYPGIQYDVFPIDISKNTQKEPWFLKINPNGRIPALVDRNRDDFVVFETAAIMLYLAQHYDKDNVLWFDPVTDPNDYSELLQWTLFSHAGIGPMQGQANHFHLFAPENVPYGKKRYTDETKRLYGVLEARLTGRDWFAGPGRGKFTIADIKPFPWVRGHPRAAIETLDEFPNLKAWLDRVANRPAVQAGLKVGAVQKL